MSDLSADIAAEMGWSDLSPGSPDDILPQDWVDDWYTAMSDAVDTQDGTWLVMDPRDFSGDEAGLYVGEWGRKSYHVTDMDYSDVETLMPYNTAYVSYETPAGVEQVVSATAEVDPYAGTGQIVAWPEDEPFHLSGPRYTDTLATSLAQKYANHYSQPQVSGRVHVTKLLAEDGPHHPWDINAGDLLSLQGYGTAVGPQRVVAVTRSPDGTAEVSVGEDETFTAKLSRAQARRLRRRRRRHR
jgi:WD40 repeat protein